jgi:RimJ/RimL family protein N-acetyltransferase
MPPSRIPVLTRPPVTLRAFQSADIPLVQEAGNDPLIPLITTVPASGDAGAARAYIQRQHDRLTSGVGYSFAIADEATDEAVGQIGLWLKNVGHGRASTGYWIASRYRGRRYATAALEAISRWALSLEGIHRVELYVEPWNEASWRTAERVGYIREGLLRNWQQVGQERRDMYVYGLLPRDLAPATHA